MTLNTIDGNKKIVNILFMYFEKFQLLLADLWAKELASVVCI
jgi:hypothetical protein